MSTCGTCQKGTLPSCFCVQPAPFLGKKRLRGDLLILYNSLNGGWSQVEDGLFSQVVNGRMRGNSLSLHQRMFRLGRRNNSFLKRIVQTWNSLPRAVVASPPLDVFRNCVDVVLRNTVQQQTRQCWVNGWARNIFSSPNYSVILGSYDHLSEN